MLRPWILVLLLAVAPRAEDWPHLQGPRRDGSYRGVALAETWPKEGPVKSWENSVGAGFAGPAVADGNVFLFHRPGDEEKLDCYDAATGELKWSNGYAATYNDDFGFDPGPRAVPSVANGKIFTYGADGVISAVAADTGKTIWRIDAKKEFKSKKGFFGRAPSPLVHGDLVMLNVGGTGAGIVALDAATGKTRWKASDDEASYSSPTLALLNGKTAALFLTRNELLAIEPERGTALFQHPFVVPMNASVTAATPLVNGNRIFLSASYGLGAQVLRVEKNSVAKVWARDDALSNHYATSVQRDGLLFGIHGRQEQRPALACVNWSDGATRWRKEFFGSGTLIVVDDRLLILLETGELVLASATAEGYKELQRAQILGAGVRAYPALADGFLYARSKDKLARFNLKR